MDAREIYIALRARHPAPEWVYLPQVRTKTGYSRTSGTDMDSERYLDAFAIHCHPSHGFRRVGYEIKVSRSDWLRELEDPRKRAQGYFLTHQFYYAFAPGVYKPGDGSVVTVRGKHWHDPLDGCGVLVVQEGGTITEERHATRREAWPMPDTFVASLLRSYVAAHRDDYLPTMEAEVLQQGSLPIEVAG